MKLPFTIEQFMEVFKNYNNAIWPLQIIFYLLAAVALFFTFRQSSNSSKIVSLILSFFWIWMGVVYHLIYFTNINNAAFLFGSLFIVQGLLFILVGVIKNNIRFSITYDSSGITGLILIVFALLLYPILGLLQNHIYPNSPTFGVPCPTTIFSFGLLLLSKRKIPIVLLIIPLFWSILGFTAAFKLGIKEDLGLLISGIISVGLIFYRNRRLSSTA